MIKIALKDVIISIIIFSIILNISTGVVAKLPVFNEFLGAGMGGLTYSDSYNKGWQDATEGINNSIPIAGDEYTSEGGQSSVLDFLSLKTFVRFFGVIDSYLFGFVNLLAGIFKGPLDSAGTGLGSWLFGGLKAIISFGYIFLMFYLFTGRNIEGTQ